MFKRLFQKINKIMIERALKSLIANFQAKNPKVFATLAVILTLAKTSIESLINQGVVPADAGWVEWVFWGIALLLGSGGVAAYKYRKEIAEIEDDPHVAQSRTQKDEIKYLEAQNEKLRELLEKA